VCNKSKVVFKNYNPNQAMLLPPSLEELIDLNHPVRTVSQVIEKIDLDSIYRKYKPGGTSSYHPRMLLKVLVYAYLSNTYSSRKIEAALKENIHFMWLSGMSKPDHNTINRFRGERLKEVLKEVFAQVVKLLTESGHVSLEEVYTDGTKIEANANRYTFVWGKAITKSKERIEQQLKELWDYAESVAHDELKDQAPTTFAATDPRQIAATIEKIDNALKDKPADKKVKQRVNYAKKNWPGNVAKYKESEKVLANRNSYSKTDKDATFMRMKEDHMKNGQLKPGYNLQISTQKQFILHYTLHQTTTDTTTLIPHLDDFNKTHQWLPKTVVADAGYGSDENYTKLEDLDIKAHVKYNYFDREQSEKNINPFISSNFRYDESKDIYYCPAERQLTKFGEVEIKTDNGFPQKMTRYQAESCNGCPLREQCHKQKNNRIIEVNHRLRLHKKAAKERLNSEQGVTYRKQRPVDVEPVFGHIKNNRKFKRFMLRGLKKVEIETGLLAMAHNLKKIAA
jgi:transposase